MIADAGERGVVARRTRRLITFLEERSSIPLQALVLRVIFSENRFPLFGITR
jgi:hypothetical protein